MAGLWYRSGRGCPWHWDGISYGPWPGLRTSRSLQKSYLQTLCYSIFNMTNQGSLRGPGCKHAGWGVFSPNHWRVALVLLQRFPRFFLAPVCWDDWVAKFGYGNNMHTSHPCEWLGSVEMGSRQWSGRTKQHVSSYLWHPLSLIRNSNRQKSNWKLWLCDFLYRGCGVHFPLGGLCAKVRTYGQNSLRRWSRYTPRLDWNLNHCCCYYCCLLLLLQLLLLL